MTVAELQTGVDASEAKLPGESMSNFTRLTTPAFSINPLQAYVTLKQARRAAKAGTVCAGVQVSAAILMILVLLLSGSPITPEGDPIRLSVSVYGVAGILLGLVTWRIWVKPGPLKIGLLLAFQLLNLATEALKIRFTNVSAICWSLVWIDIEIVALRGALSMKPLGISKDIDVF